MFWAPRYLPNPFHNFAHAVDVVHATAKILRRAAARKSRAGFMDEPHAFSLVQCLSVTIMLVTCLGLSSGFEPRAAFLLRIRWPPSKDHKRNTLCFHCRILGNLTLTCRQVLGISVRLARDIATVESGFTGRLLRHRQRQQYMSEGQPH